MSMKNETAIITGSTSGIGKTIAKLFLREGAKVAICSRHEEKVNQILSELKEEFGDNIIGAVCDVSDHLAVKNLVSKTIEAFGGVRVLVANAGFNVSYGPFEFLSLEEANEEAKKVIGTNLIGAIQSISAVLPQMKKQGYGRIITLAGGGADRPLENMTIYSASKGGVLAFSKCLAEEFKQNSYDLKINIFFPGMIYTNLMRNSQVIEEWKNEAEYREELDLTMKYVATDIEESCSKVIPYALPSCKTNGKSFRGFSIVKLIKGFRKVNKERKRMEKP
jgi:NAD(P)-dependent dehydrogenase (short-subunit alcohol dehydrogenase family)